MSKCGTCGAPVNLAPDGDPRYEAPRRRGMDPYTLSEWRQRVWGEALDDAAKLAFEYPAEKHGSLDADPFKAARQATYEVGLAIEALKENGK